ncbi:MAG TPA: diacylglycerol kinase family lipid kinase [Chloroflexota bacterium]|nr:diacylglycerol kinase family lipid kinase [Chloroflexota bacterium]HUM67821.1 diacylglycerol kinase family lipid kinase [Chloroflexota bacterium]
MVELWQSCGWQVTTQATNAPGHATVLAQQAAMVGHQVVLAAGGDGTLGEVANGLAGTETIMAPLPMGTANSFARELLMPLPNRLEKYKLREAAQALLAGRVQYMDIGWLEDAAGHGRNWLLWAGTGVDGYLVDRVEPRPRWSKRLGRLGYYIQSVAAAAHLPTMNGIVEVDGVCYEDNFVLALISNCRLYAGGQIVLSPDARLDDGQVEVWLFRGEGLADTVQLLYEAKLERHHHHPNVTRINGRRITIQATPPAACQTDGDKAGYTPLHFSVKTRALRLLAPNTAPADLFSLPGEALPGNR